MYGSALKVLHSGMLLPCLLVFKLCSKSLSCTNALAYFVSLLVTKKKFFYVDSSSSSQHRGDLVTPSRNDVGRSSSSASHSSSLGGPIIPPPKSYSSSISDDDRNNDVGSPCSIILEGTTVDDTEDNDVTRTSDQKDSTLPNGHVDSEEDSGVHVMAKSVDEFQELPHDDEVQKETVVRLITGPISKCVAFLLLC